MQTVGARPLGVTALITRLGELFIADRIPEATQFWSFPCPTQVAGEMIVMRDAAALEAFFRRRREVARAAGLLSMTPRVIAIEVPREQRLRVWFRWIRHYPDRAVEDADTSIFFMRRRCSGHLTIEMMDILRVPVEVLGG